MPFSRPLESGSAKILAHIPGVEVSTSFFFVHFFFDGSNALSAREFRRCGRRWVKGSGGGGDDGDVGGWDVGGVSNTGVRSRGVGIVSGRYPGV